MLIFFFIIVIVIVIFFVVISVNDKNERNSFSKEKEELERRLEKIPLNERKCSSCKYGDNVKNYGNKIGAECTYNSIEIIDGFYVRGRGEGEFVWEEEHIGCKNYDNPFASFL